MKDGRGRSRGPASPTHLPDGVQHIPILEYPEQLVVRGDLVKMSPFLIRKEQIRLPNGVQHGRVQVQRVIWVLRVGQPGVVPLLPEEDVHTVVLPIERPPSSGKMHFLKNETTFTFNILNQIKSLRECNILKYNAAKEKRRCAPSAKHLLRVSKVKPKPKCFPSTKECIFLFIILKHFCP